MKFLFWLGLVALILGVVLLFVPVPRTHKQGVKAGDVSFGVETRTQEKVSPIVCAGLIVAGAGLLIAGRARAS